MRFLKNAAVFLPIFLCSANVISQTRPIANAISAKSGADRTIEIEWNFPKQTVPEIVGAKLYRASKPITSYKEIEADSPIAVLSETRHTDFIQKAGDYFYAVIAVTSYGDYKAVIPGMNVTTKGAHARISEKSEDYQKKDEKNDFVALQEDAENDFEDSKETSQKPAAESEVAQNPEKKKSHLPFLSQEDEFRMRGMPLPLPADILGFGDEAHKTSDEAKQSVANLANPRGKKKAEPFKTPYFFEDDMFAPDGGDEYILFETLREGLVQRKYRESARLLIDFLSVNRDADTTNRAEFYLGESFYFCGEYKNAVQCFLSVQEIFPALTKKWIDSSLDLMEDDF